MAQGRTVGPAPRPIGVGSCSRYGRSTTPPEDPSADADHDYRVHHPIVIPNLRDAIRHALPNVVEGKVVPVVLFVGLLEVTGSTWALLAALAWSLSSITYRRATGRRVPGLVVLSALALLARTVAALASGSMFVYFLQPTVTTVAVGLAFMASVALGNPLALRLACDVLPFDDATTSHPLVRQFFIRLSVLWAITSLVNASITIWLLVTQSTTTFVLVKSVLGPSTAGVTIAIAAIWFKLTLMRSPVTLIWSSSRRAPVTA